MSNAGWTTDEDLNMGKVSTDDPVPLPKGIYLAEITKAAPKQVGSEKKPGYELQLKVTQIFGGDALDTPRKMFDTTPVTKETAFRAKQLAEAAGVDAPQRSNYEAIETFCGELVGKQVIVRTKQREHEGKWYHAVDRYLTEEKAKIAAAGGEAPAGDASSSDAAPAGGGRRGKRTAAAA